MLTWRYFSQVFMGVDAPIEDTQRVRGAFYRGSQVLQPLSEFMHVPLDQINYVLCGLLSIAFGHLLMRRRFSPHRTSPRVRAVVEIMLGLLLVSFCFGNQLRVLLLQSTVAYALLFFLPHSQATAILVTVWSMFYMTLVHLCRLQYDYGGYTLDISGPVMVQTQRLSSLAFNLADGRLIRQEERRRRATKQFNVQDKPEPVSPCLISPSPSGDMTPMDYAQASMQSLSSLLIRRLKSLADGSARSLSEHVMFANGRLERLRSVTPSWSGLSDQANTLTCMPPSHIEHAVDKLPGLVEFFAYTLCYHGVSVGPFIFYTEYQAYLKGYEKHQLPAVGWRYFFFALLRTIAAGLLSAYMSPYFPFEFVLNAEFINWPVFRRILYCTISLFLVRQKYYFAWGLAEVGGISAGVGFTRYCPTDGRPMYEHVRNFDLRQIEAALSLKNVIDSWNISTARWLREVFYDRLPHSIRTLPVFIISAFWHGFYPGYYLMFLTFALFTFVSRMWRRKMRTFCRQAPWTAHIYDLFTMVLTNLAINYAQAPFHLLDLSASLTCWQTFYFLPHSLCLLLQFGHLIQPRLIRSVRSARRQQIALGHGRMVGG
ncbi:lysophospholipid acyltransferase 1/2 [Paragonimus westermani]|uniref:Lysophospholipid acyltransferase 1/2 n=1 Tax=Paragonimus westermani TaxID=34504 RepID=A0A5J4NIL1_9TREM|nr:lysophospholipid acyltransferase 1/2 [Paragonimus westermani]